MRASGVAIAGLSIILRCNAFDDKGTYLGGFIPLCRTNMMVVVGRPGLCGARLSHSSVDLRDIRTSLRLELALLVPPLTHHVRRRSPKSNFACSCIIVA